MKAVKGARARASSQRLVDSISTHAVSAVHALLASPTPLDAGTDVTQRSSLGTLRLSCAGTDKVL